MILLDFCQFLNIFISLKTDIKNDRTSVTQSAVNIFSIFNYALGPAAIKALPSSLVAYLTKFHTKRAAKSSAFDCHCALSA